MEGILIHDKKTYQIEIPSNTSDELYVICPVCTPSRKSIHQKEKKLAINIPKRTARCNHCGEAFKFVFKSEYKEPVKSHGLLEPDSAILSFFEKRKISKNTLESRGVKMAYRNIRQKNGEFKKMKCTAFTFHHNNVLKAVKFRDGKKNFAFEKNSTLIFWGLDWIKGSKECMIVEGEIDALSYVEIGYLPVASVPAGTTISDREKEIFERTGDLIVENPLNLKYLDSAIKEFEDKELIIIATDADAAGIKLRKELVRRLGKHRCKFIDYSKYKISDSKSANDGNNVLVELGPDVLRQTIDEAQEYKIEDVITIDDDWSNILRLHEEGYTRGKSTGFPALDPHFNWMFGHLIALNGYPNMGKTVFAINLIVLSAMKYGWKWGLYTPENYPTYDTFVLLIEIYLGNTMEKKAQDRINKVDLMEAKDFIRSHFEIINRPAGYDPNSLRDIANMMISRRGIRGFLTDPWNSLIHNTRGNLDEYLERELSSEQRFAIDNNIIKIINAHPPTPKDKNNLTAPSPFQIRGGNIWWAKAYEMLCLHDPGDESNGNMRELYVQKVKYFKTTGIPTRENFIPLDFQDRTNRYIQLNDEYNPFTDVKGKPKEQPEIDFTEF